MHDIIKIIKSLNNGSVLIDGVTETVKQQIKKPKKVDTWRFFNIYGCFINSTYGLFVDRK